MPKKTHRRFAGFPDLDLVETLLEVCSRAGYGLDLINPAAGSCCRLSAFSDMPDIHPATGFMLRVSHGNRFFITGAGNLCSWPLNQATAVSIANDKARTAAVLRCAGLPVPKTGGFILTDRYGPLHGTGLGMADARAFADAIGYPVIVKPNQGSLGWLVNVAADSTQLDDCLRQIGEHQPVGLVQEYTSGDEYRVFLLDGNVEFAYRRKRPVLVGDGRRTIRRLLEDQNKRLIAAGNSPVSADSYWLRRNLEQHGLTLLSVLKPEQRLEYCVRANISAGGTIDAVLFSVPDPLAELGRRAAHALNLRVVGLDLILPRGIETPALAFILEANGNPWISALYRNGYKSRVCDIWEKVCRLYFDMK